MSAALAVASPVELFGNVVLGDPLSALLAAIGAILVGLPVAALAYLGAGAAFELVSPA
jgi:NO-binding membrane sensor protein with MHYT domain